MHAVARQAVTTFTMVMSVVAGSARLDAVTWGPSEKSYLDDRGGIQVLVLRGTPEEMGYAHGYLLAEKVKAVYQSLARALKSEMDEDEQAAAAAEARPHIPQRFVDEVRAIARGANKKLGKNLISADRLLEMHSWDEICNDSMERGCCAHFAALNSATRDGHVVLGIDYVDEPCVRRGVRDGAVVIVYEPEDANPFCTVTWAGFAGAMVGINNLGLAVSESRFPSSDQRFDGTPLPFQVRRVLEEAANVDEAEDLLRSVRRTVSGNVLVADGFSSPTVKAFEFTANRFEVFHAGDPRESQSHVVQPESVPVTIDLEGYVFTLLMPQIDAPISVEFLRPVPDAIVRGAAFAHHQGDASLQKLQYEWMIDFVGRDPDFDFLDLSETPVEDEEVVLSIAYMVDMIVSGFATSLLNPVIVEWIIDPLYPDWNMDLFEPDAAALSRLRHMRDLVEERHGSIGRNESITILGGGVDYDALDALREPNSLHCVVMDATTLDLWVAQAPPTDSAGKPDADRQPFHHVDFVNLTVFPLTVDTTPVPGNVFVDGEDWGKVPQSQRLPAGTYEVSFGPVEGYQAPEPRIIQLGPQSVTVTGEYRQQVKVEIVGEGDVNPVADGDLVRLEATPDPGWHFDRWSGGIMEEDPWGRSITAEDPTAWINPLADGPVSVTATFLTNPPGTHSLTVRSYRQGRSTPTKGVFPEGTEVTLLVDSADGWHLERWSDDVLAQEDQRTVVMDAHRVLAPVFEPGNYRFRVSVCEGVGHVDVIRPVTTEGGVVTAHAHPAPGYYFSGWSWDASGHWPSVALPYTKHRHVCVAFKPRSEDKRVLTVQSQGPGSTVPGTAIVDPGAKVMVEATPDPDGRFVGWSGGVNSEERILELSLTDDTVIRATFEPGAYSVEVSIQGKGHVIMEPPGGTYAFGTEVTLTAVADETSEPSSFVRWKGLKSTEDTVSLEVTEDRKIVAVFEDGAGHPIPALGQCCAPAGVVAIGLLVVGGCVLSTRVRRGPIGRTPEQSADARD